jgi:hypothetical protein
MRATLYELFEQHGIYVFEKPSATAKRLIKHHVIHMICERIRKANSHGNLRTIIYANKEEFEATSNLPNVYVERVVWHALSDVESKLPIRIYFAKYSYSDFVNPHISTGLVKEVKVALSDLTEKDFSSFTFEKVRKFSEKEGLNYLSKEYFQSLKAKLIMSV